VIGFIYMLGSISQVTSVDIQALQQLLSNMSGGMRIALYTTLTGLGGGILLGLQYRLLDQAVDRLMAEIIELSEVDITAELRQLLAEQA
jgi:biopolymer transport protein ExbB/TolQ